MFPLALAEINFGAFPGAPSGQTLELEAVKATVTLPPLEPRGTDGTLLTSEAVKVSVTGLGLFDFTVKVTLPFESVAPVKLLVPNRLPLMLKPESFVLTRVTWSPDKTFPELSFTTIMIVTVVTPSAGIEPELTVIVDLSVSALLFA